MTPCKNTLKSRSLSMVFYLKPHHHKTIAQMGSLLQRTFHDQPVVATEAKGLGVFFSNKLRGDPEESHSGFCFLTFFEFDAAVGSVPVKACDSTDAWSIVAVGERALVTGLRFFFSITSSFDIENAPLMQLADAKSLLQGLRGCIANLISLSNLLGDRSVENASGFLPGLFRRS